MRSRAGIRAVLWSLGILGLTALVQAVILVATGSVALLADLIHNVGDAATAIPVGIAFLLRSFRAEKVAGLFVVGAIFISACVALYATIDRFLNPEPLSNLGVLAAAGVVGFIGNELAAQVRLRAGPEPREPRADRGRQPRARGRLRVARCRRERHRGLRSASIAPTRSSASRSRS